MQIALGLTGLAGFIYSLDVLRGVPKIENYTMVLEDWLWHVLFPLLAYGATVGAALSFQYQTAFALFLFGGASVLLVFIGIHNAWDTVTHLTMQRIQREQEKTGK